MDVYGALRFSASRISNELFSAGSIFSVYSLATTFLIAVGALAYQRKIRRGRVNLRAIARAIFDKRLLLSKSFAADVKLLILSVVLMPVVVGALVLSSNAVATAVSAALLAAAGLGIWFWVKKKKPLAIVFIIGGLLGLILFYAVMKIFPDKMPF